LNIGGAPAVLAGVSRAIAVLAIAARWASASGAEAEVARAYRTVRKWLVDWAFNTPTMKRK